VTNPHRSDFFDVVEPSDHRPVELVAADVLHGPPRFRSFVGVELSDCFDDVQRSVQVLGGIGVGCCFVVGCNLGTTFGVEAAKFVRLHAASHLDDAGRSVKPFVLLKEAVIASRADVGLGRFGRGEETSPSTDSAAGFVECACSGNPVVVFVGFGGGVCFHAFIIHV